MYAEALTDPGPLLVSQVFAAKSEVLRLPLPDRPRGVHLSLTSDPSEMRVTWKGGGKSPEVHFYRAGHEHERPLVVQASTSTYTADDVRRKQQAVTRRARWG